MLCFFPTPNCVQCAQERIESVQEVYQKHWSEDKISKDGLKCTSKSKSIVKTYNQANRMVINSPRRSLVPKSLSYALTPAKKHHATNGNNNVGLELVKPVHNFDANGFGDGVVSTIDESIISSPILRKNGVAYYEKKTITTTTTTTTATTKMITLQKIMVPSADETQDLPPIEVGTCFI